MSKDKKKRRYGNAVENAEKRSSGGNYGYIKIPEGVKMFTPEAETTALIDILPYEVTDKHHMDKIEVETLWYKKLFKVHKYIGVNNESYVCPTTFGKPCPVCEHGNELKKENADEKEIDKTKPKWRSLYAVKVREYDGKKKFDPDVIHLFDFSEPLFQKQLNTLKKKKEFANFFLHDEGCSLEITFDADSFDGNKYVKVTRIDFVPRKKQYKDDILDKVPNLDEVLIVPTFDELEAAFFGESGVGSDDEPKKDKKKDKGKKDKAKDEAPEKSEKKKDKKKKSEPTTEELIENAEDVGELIDIIKAYPVTFGDFKKELKKIEKVKKLKTRMLEIMEEAGESKDTDGLPFKKTADKSEGGEKKKDKKKDKKSKDECPYNHTFGKDTDKYDDCKDCDLWNECKAAKKAAKKNKD